MSTDQGREREREGGGGDVCHVGGRFDDRVQVLELSVICPRE